MKKIAFLIILMFTLVTVFSSCEKNENTDEVRMRLTKIADNADMENPLFVFEYGSDGLLSVIIEEYLSSKWISEIVYDSNKKPVAINRKSYYNGSLENESTINIDWNSDGFKISRIDGDSRYIFLLNSQNNIESRISSYKDYLTQEFDTSSVQYFNWTDDSQVIRLFDYESPWSVETAEGDEVYKFDNQNSPFKGIDISILLAANIELGEWEGEVQNKHCLIEYSEDSYGASITYDFNEQGFPKRADITYTSEEGVEHDYLYFEYESY